MKNLIIGLIALTAVLSAVYLIAPDIFNQGEQDDTVWVEPDVIEITLSFKTAESIEQGDFLPVNVSLNSNRMKPVDVTVEYIISNARGSIEHSENQEVFFNENYLIKTAFDTSNLEVGDYSVYINAYYNKGSVASDHPFKIIEKSQVVEPAGFSIKIPEIDWNSLLLIIIILVIIIIILKMLMRKPTYRISGKTSFFGGIKDLFSPKRSSWGATAPKVRKRDKIKRKFSFFRRKVTRSKWGAQKE